MEWLETVTVSAVLLWCAQHAVNTAIGGFRVLWRTATGLWRNRETHQA